MLADVIGISVGNIEFDSYCGGTWGSGYFFNVIYNLICGNII